MPAKTLASLLLALTLASLTILSASVAGDVQRPGDGDDDATWDGPQYRNDHTFYGRIGCAVAAPPVATNDLCARYDPNTQASFSFDMDKGISGIAIHLDADSVVQAPDLMLTWATPVNLIDTFAGTVPFRFVQELSPAQEQTQQRYHAADGSPARFHVHVNPAADVPQAVVDQPIKVHISVFYNGAPIPPGFDPTDPEDSAGASDTDAQWPGEPFHADHEFRGLIGCAVSKRPVATTDLCGGFMMPVLGTEVPALNPNANSDMTFDMAAGISGIAIKLEAPAGPTGAKPALWLGWQTPVALIDPMAGVAPLVHRQTFDPAEPSTQVAYTHESGAPAKFEVRMDPNASVPNVAYEQRFDVCLRVFYNGEPIPDGFVPDC